MQKRNGTSTAQENPAKEGAARYIYNSTTNISEFCKRFLVVENGGSASAQYPIHQRHYYQYFYPFPFTSYFSSGSSVLYSEVAEYSGTGSASNGKTVYTYTDNLDQAQHETVRFNSQPLPYRSYEWKNGLLLSKKVYKNNSTAPIYSLINEYDYLLESEALNLGVAEYADIVDVDPTINYPSSVPHGTTHQLNAEEIKNNLANTTHGYIVPFTEAVDGSLFDYYNYYITTGLPVVKSSTETQDGISKTTFYDYNHLGLPTKVKAIDSRGGSISTIYKYPGDFNTAPYTAMANNHILSPVIQQEQYKNTSFLSKTVNEYKHWGNGMYEPEIIKFQASASDALTNRITYHNRDARGNPQYISKDGNDKVVYLWGYNYQYPVAKIENATYSDICKIVGNNNEATGKTALDNIAKKEEPVTADWTTINNLRTNTSLSNAMVTTYTYKPLVGMLTAINPQGVSESYTYDNFGRLSVVKDHNNKSLSDYSYNYGVTPLQITVPTDASYTVTSTSHSRSFSATVTQNIGALKYDWYLKNSSNTVVASSINTANSTYSVDLLTPALLYDGAMPMTLTCVAKDDDTGQTVQIDKNFTVNLATEFWNANKSLSSGSYFVFAKVNCVHAGTIRFRIQGEKLGTNAFMKVQFRSGEEMEITDNSFNFYHEINGYQGMNQVMLNIGYDGSSYPYMVLEIESITGGNIKGNTTALVLNGYE